MEGGFGLRLRPRDDPARDGRHGRAGAKSQQVAFADNAISLAVQMTVAAVGRITPEGSAEEQSKQLREAITRIYPECVALVREARQGLQ